MVLTTALPLGVKASVRMETVVTPCCSRRMPSATLATLHDPQSPMTMITMSQREARLAASPSRRGRPK
jgi:hypothetical protein